MGFKTGIIQAIKQDMMKKVEEEAAAQDPFYRYRRLDEEDVRRMGLKKGGSIMNNNANVEKFVEKVPEVFQKAMENINPASVSPMGMKKGGAVKKMKKSGTGSSASKRADGIAMKGKTRGRMV